MKRWTWAVIGAAIIIGGIALYLSQQKKEPDVIKIGAILPLTGPAGKYGQYIKEGLELAREEINEKGGINGKKLEIIYEDDQANPTMATNAMWKLVNESKVPLIFGSWASSCVLAMAPIAEKTHTVIMAEAISPKIRDAGDYVFRIQPDARYYLKKLVPFVYNDLGVRKVAILYVNNDFGVDQAKVFKKEFEKLGGEVVFMEGFEQGATDFKTELSKIRKYNPEAIFCPAYTEIGIVLKQAREMKMSQRFIASVPFENPEILRVAGKAAEGVIYPHHFDPDSKEPIVQEFQKKYESRYGRKAEGFAALAYDGLRIIAHVLKICGSNSECIKDELYKVKDFPGVTGPTTFDDHGDVIKPIIIKTVKNGKFVRYKEETENRKEVKK